MTTENDERELIKNQSTLSLLWDVKPKKDIEKSDPKSLIVVLSSDKLKRKPIDKADWSGKDHEEVEVVILDSPERVKSAPSSLEMLKSKNQVVHPFFQPRKKPKKEQEKRPLRDDEVQILDVKDDVSPKVRKSLVVTLRIPSLKKAKEKKTSAEKATTHPFFLPRRKESTQFEETKTDSANPKIIEIFESSEEETPKLVKREKSDTKPKDDIPVHPFFQKRKDKSSSTTPTNSFTSSRESYARSVYPPYPQLPHVRDLSSGEVSILRHLSNSGSIRTAKNKSKEARMELLNSEYVVTKSCPVHLQAYKQQVLKAHRSLKTPTCLKKLAYENIKDDHTPTLQYLLDLVPELIPFDTHTCDQTSWSVKYRPKKRSQVAASAISLDSVDLLNWLKFRLQQLKKFAALQQLNEQKKRKTALDGFIVDDKFDDYNEDTEMDENYTSFCLIYGPPGCGKTSSVYAVGQELNTFVFEVNSSQKRSGKELLELLEGVGQSHLIHSRATDQNQNSIILLDDVDVIYATEKTFWAGISKFANESRRPIVMTCTDMSLIPDSFLEENEVHVLEYKPAEADLHVDILYLIALSEGHYINNKRVLYDILSQNDNDLRRSIAHLQFWCQKGIGDRISGINWVISRQEIAERGELELRVISQGEYLGQQRKEESSKPLIILEQFDALSVSDLLSTQTYSAFANDSTPDPETERLYVDYTRELPLKSSPLSYELQPYHYFEEYFEEYVASSETPSTPLGPFCRQQLNYFMAEDAGYNIVECLSDSSLAVEVLPYVRAIAADDYKKESFKQEKIKSLNDDGSNGRLTRRSLVALGIEDTKSHLNCTLEELESIIHTVPETWRTNASFIY